MLLVNEVPDRTADALAGKRTLAVRLGPPGVAWLYGALQFCALAGAAGFVVDQDLPWWSFLALVVVLAPLLASARAGGPSRPAALDPGQPGRAYPRLPLACGGAAGEPAGLTVGRPWTGME